MLGCAALAAYAAADYDANGVALGAPETMVIAHFPSAHCQPLQWASRAAERRCDDARISFAGANARITFYLKDGMVQAFDVGFDSRDTERVVAFLKERYGAPAAESRSKAARPGKAPLDLHSVRWERGRDRAVLTAQMERRRASLIVSRGDFEEEIYRVR